MRIGARLLDHHHHHVNNGGSSVGYVNKMIKKKRTCYKRIIKKAPPPIPMALQELFDACRDIFKGSGTAPSPEDVLRLSRILGMFSSFPTEYDMEALSEIVNYGFII